jgi:hypothetical protein
MMAGVNGPNSLGFCMMIGAAGGCTTFERVAGGNG